MKYLDNNICELTPLFPIDYSIKKNIISCSFFKLSTTPYKNFNKYIDGLEVLYEEVYNKYKKENFIIRLFIDNTIHNDKNLFNRIEKMNKIETVLYSCSDYLLEPDKKHHIGLFGTFVRFFPMFDFPNNDANIVIISDIDDTRFLSENFKRINRIKSNVNFDKIYIYKQGDISSSILFGLEPLNNQIVNTYSLASNFISFKKCSHLVVYNFLNKMNNSDKIFSLYIYKIKLNQELLTDDKFLYGFDEYFLNVDLTNYLIDNQMPFCTDFIWSINGNIYFYCRKKIFSQEKILLVNTYLNTIIKNLKLKISTGTQDDIIKKYSSIDKLLWNKQNNLSTKIYYEFYKFYLEHLNDIKYNFLFDPDIFDIIKKFNLFGSYNVELIAWNMFDKTNENNKKNFDIIINHKFELNLIANLKTINLTKKNIPFVLTCDISFDSNTSNHKHKIKEINVPGGITVVKKLFLNSNNSDVKNISNEDIFIKKYLEKIKNDGLDVFIAFPIKNINCNNSILYQYDDFLSNYNCVIESCNFTKWIVYTIQICLTVYYLNNILGIYHNDLYDRNKLKNIMVKKNTDNNQINMKISDYDININSNHIMLINFEEYSSEPKNNTLLFYQNNFMSNENNNFNFENKFISEVFIIYYYSYKSFFNHDDYFNTKYKDIYNYIATHSKTLKEFDNHILNFLFNLYNSKF